MFTFSLKKLCNLILLFSVISFSLQCEKGQTFDSQEVQVEKYDSIERINKDSLIQDSVKRNTVVYHDFCFPKKKRDSAMAVFNKEYSQEDQHVILALNRLDLKNKWRADTLSIPDRIDSTLMVYTPFPQNLEILKGVHKIVLFSYKIQAFSVYQNGKLIRWGPTSMGSKAAQTKRGLMFTNWKKKLSISSVSSEWKLPYNFNVQNTLGIGWHQYDLPGYPASHSCLRLLMNDAKFLYGWADQWILNIGGTTVKANGTPVIVFGDYKWGAKKPWKNLSINPKSNNISVKDMNAAIEPNLPKILEEQEKRKAIEASENQH
ncbi:L,D-transpeptidase [Kaistella sp.]|uniref:L,D-transpeptidase n=1 Tax=Kaistella sp. TaxID=2782235 RepID=UPI003C4234DE